jgi:hypothetical protein
MYECDELEVWNLTPGVPALVGAQRIFNVVGHLKSPEKTGSLFYSLNGGPERPVFVKRNSNTNDSVRLERLGDFNLDTIHLQDLRPNNRIILRTSNGTSASKTHSIDFPIQSYQDGLPYYRLNLNEIDHPQQVGQIVDGKWHVGRDRRGEPCLEIRAEDAGYDRLIVFGSEDWTTGYEVTARFCVTAWTNSWHVLGLFFKWNPHAQGDGTCLPDQWSTGMGISYSVGPGLTIAIGVDVHSNAHGTTEGLYILREGSLSLRRQRIRKIRKLLGVRGPFSQLPTNRQYLFRMRVDPDHYALTVWKNGSREPQPQVCVPKPIERLSKGSVGVVAHYCSVRIYELNVSPI